MISSSSRRRYHFHVATLPSLALRYVRALEGDGLMAWPVGAQAEGEYGRKRMGRVGCRCLRLGEPVEVIELEGRARQAFISDRGSS